MQLELLWSINERLGGRAGLDLQQPGTDWMDDIASSLRHEKE